jgi:hypothetical protein
MFPRMGTSDNMIAGDAPSAFGARVQALVERSGLGWSELDALADLPRGTLWNITHEPGREPRLALVRALRVLFRVEYAWLIDGDGPAARSARRAIREADHAAMRAHLDRALGAVRRARVANDNAAEKKAVSRLHRRRPAARRRVRAA